MSVAAVRIAAAQILLSAFTVVHDTARVAICI